MSVSYRFKTKDGEVVKLAQVDEAMCLDSNRPVQEKVYHPNWDDMINFGLAILIQGGSIVTAEAFDARVEEMAAKLPHDEEWLRSTLAFYRKFLVEQFTFEAWR